MVLRILILLVFPLVSFAGEIADLHPALERERSVYRQIREVSRSLDEANSKDHSIDVIGIERQETFGTGPTYTLVIDRDGTFQYVAQGGSGVKRTGAYTGTIPEWLFDRLSHYIDDLDYMSLPSDYRVTATDQSLVYTMVVSDGVRKTILNHGNAGPAESWALQQAIENTLRYAEWNEE